MSGKSQSSKWSSGSDQERLNAFKSKLATADVTPAYYRTGDLGVDARMESGKEYRSQNGFVAGQCPCGGSNPAGTKFCVNCGKAVPTAPPPQASIACSSCHSALPAGSKFCAQCGTPSSAVSQPSCSHCGTKLSGDAKFCVACGQKV